jgi:predicted membrane channel-forming protein YqfA (hemolysin III family)
MHIVALAWMFVVVLMTLAEATSTQGTVLGALFTFLLYGVLPLGIVLYVMGTPARGRARRAAAAEAEAEAEVDTDTEAALVASAAMPQDSMRPPSATQGNGSGQAAGAGLTAERKEP